MRTYRIDCTDNADRVVTTHEVTCRGDLEALDEAQKLCAKHGVEVWEGERRVVWMHKGGTVRVEPSSAITALPADWLGANPLARQWQNAN